MPRAASRRTACLAASISSRQFSRPSLRGTSLGHIVEAAARVSNKRRISASICRSSGRSLVDLHFLLQNLTSSQLSFHFLRISIVLPHFAQSLTRSSLEVPIFPVTLFAEEAAALAKPRFIFKLLSSSLVSFSLSNLLFSSEFFLSPSLSSTSSTSSLLLFLQCLLLLFSSSFWGSVFFVFLSARRFLRAGRGPAVRASR
mmetsp:Transcript_16327/g.31692  ORF Transcript_16327/g.31692 Transcript_16327/m.31692 type:complete len:200 (+) Transcript_16327:725-1324(+)